MKRKLFTAVCFLLAAAMLPSGASAAGAEKGPKKEGGIQLYSVRSLIGVFGKSEGDYKPVLQALADMGYTFVEAASYNDGKFYGQTPEQFKADVEAVGMKVLSSHCTRNLSDEELASGDFSESLKWWDECIAAHKAAGMKYLVTPSMPFLKSLKELQVYCDYFNEIGKRCRENGIKYGYHNHAFEFQKIEDQVMLEYMIRHTDPENVLFEMDVYWVVIGQNSPVDQFRRQLPQCRRRRRGADCRRSRAVQLRRREERQDESGLPDGGTLRQGILQQVNPVPAEHLRLSVG